MKCLRRSGVLTTDTNYRPDREPFANLTERQIQPEENFSQRWCSPTSDRRVAERSVPYRQFIRPRRPDVGHERPSNDGWRRPPRPCRPTGYADREAATVAARFQADSVSALVGGPTTRTG